MVRHIVMWNHKPGFSAGEKAANAARAKELLEALPAQVPGTISLTVRYSPLESSNRDVMLESAFETPEALRSYIDHPQHKQAGQFIRSVLEERACFDFEEDAL